MTSKLVRHPIVAGVDGSLPALHAAVWAADEAARRHVPLRVVYAVRMSAFAYTSEYCPPESFFEGLETEGRRYLAAAETAVRSWGSEPYLRISPQVTMEIPL